MPARRRKGKKNDRPCVQPGWSAISFEATELSRVHFEERGSIGVVLIELLQHFRAAGRG